MAKVRHLTTDDLLMVQEEGVDLDTATAWTFVGDSVTITDDEPGDATVITVAGGAPLALHTDMWIRYINTGWVGTSASVSLDLGALDDEGDSSFIAGGTDLANGLIEVVDAGLYVMCFQMLGNGYLTSGGSSEFPATIEVRVPTPYGGFEIDQLMGLSERLRGHATPASGDLVATVHATVPLAAGAVVEVNGYGDPPNETYDITTYIARIM